MVAGDETGRLVSPVHVTYGLDALPGDGRPRAVTIGKFDGVHRGHQQVLRQLIENSQGAEPTVITFDRHPHAVVKPHEVPRPVVSEAQKVELLSRHGIKRVVVLAFDGELQALTHEEFSARVLADGLSARLVLVGADFRYGNGGAGNADTLRAEGRQWGFRVDAIADVCEAGGQRVSSTMIRRALDEGRVAEVWGLLGRYHSVRGIVGTGFQRGRVLGYPTANLATELEGYIPADGVYATKVHVEGAVYPAATSIGLNPTFGDVHERTIESHLFDVELDLYGKQITVEFVEFIRGMQKFPDANALAAQMGRDEEQIRVLLSQTRHA